MKSSLLCRIFSFILLCNLVSLSAFAAEYDLVLEGGRVIDPESGLDAVRNIAVKNGKIVRISRGQTQG